MRGHSQSTLTLDTYLRLIPGLRQDAAQKTDALLAPVPQANELVAVNAAGNSA